MPVRPVLQGTRHKPFADGRTALSGGSLLFAAGLMMLAGCAAGTGRTADRLTGIAPDTCGATRLAGFKGLTVDELDEQYLPQVVRALRPGDPVTEDFNPARLNVDLDANGTMTRFWCG